MLACTHWGGWLLYVESVSAIGSILVLVYRGSVVKAPLKHNRLTQTTRFTEEVTYVLTIGVLLLYLIYNYK